MPKNINYKVMVVDDDAVHLDKLGHDLGKAKNIKIAGSFTDSALAAKEIFKIKPDVLLTDLEMPGVSGLELICLTKESLPSTEIIALTVHGRQEMVLKAIEAGASGYLLKGCEADEIIDAIVMIREGGSPLSPEVARLLVQERQSRPAHYVELTGAELGIVRNISKGLSYKEIASLQHVTTHAIHWHISNIYKKLQAKSRTELLSTARKIGLV
jgi:DNA-binding NarL/FixJ family response regulator